MYRGTLAYCGPEVLSNIDGSFASDVYSFGVILWELYTAQAPYAGLSEWEVFKRKVGPFELPLHCLCRPRQRQFIPDVHGLHVTVF